MEISRYGDEENGKGLSRQSGWWAQGTTSPQCRISRRSSPPIRQTVRHAQFVPPLPVEASFCHS